MFQEFFAKSDLLHLPQVALGLFFLIFLLVVLYAAFGWRDTRESRRVWALPLEDDGSKNVEDTHV